MLDACADHACCGRCAGAGAATAARIARRRLLKAAVFRPADAAAPAGGSRAGGSRAGGSRAAAFAACGDLPRAITGAVIDVSPHFLVLSHGTGQERLALTPDATAWRGGPLDPAAVRPGDQAVVRLRARARGVADRIWANIGRVTGTIIERTADGLVVDEGMTRKRQLVSIPPRASARIQVRFPSLEPGYLIDVIGLRRSGALEALVPATYQPAYRVRQLPAAGLPAPALAGGHVPDAISGSATWHEPGDEPPGIAGLGYPAVDPEARCAEGPGPQVPGNLRLPYLSIGSILLVRNDCTGSSCALPVNSCAAVGRLFNDRCVTCGTSPRSRVADLTQASFVALGGELERGCFNATITIGG
ncbi:MAG: hypothetical protein ABSA03_16890 [Streptosporangiaceae bacterium]|jgi:hypothetical protein